VKRLFSPDAIKAEIENLKQDRERIDQAIGALEAALRSIEGLDTHQKEFKFDPGDGDVTLQDAVKRVCMNLVDGITRQRVIGWIERQYPFLKPNSSSVSAALINLSKGDNPMLHLAVPGKGRSPAVYSTQGETSFRLNAEEAEALLDEALTRGSGGWQSLWAALQRSYNKATGVITLTAELRGRLFHYYHSYGGGGWQNAARKVFRREAGHLFVA
jgi:hypothetical protein